MSSPHGAQITLNSRNSTLLSTLLLASLLITPSLWAAADLAAQRLKFRAATKALNAGQRTKSAQIAQGLEDYPLFPYLRYEQLRRNLHRAKRADVREFLAANENTAMGESLRTRWLEQLARRNQWKTFLQDYRPQRSAKLQCAQLLARVKTKALSGVVQDAIPLWMIGESQHEQCDPAFALLYKSSLLTEQLLWQRIRITIAEGNPALAGYLGRKLPADSERWVTLWREARRDPARALRNKALADDTPRAREIVAYAIERSARRSLDFAIRQWPKLRSRYSFEAAQSVKTTTSKSPCTTQSRTISSTRTSNVLVCAQLFVARIGRHWLVGLSNRLQQR